MVDNCPKMWYNVRRRGKYSFAPFCIFPDVRIYQILEKFLSGKIWKRITFFKNFHQLRANALAGFFQISPQYSICIYRYMYVYMYFNVYVYINIQVYMCINKLTKNQIQINI